MAPPAASSDGYRLPDVIGIGAEKCGTTSLHYYLRAHPEIGVQKVKETRFFALSGTLHRGVDWYVRQFPRGAKVLVESQSTVPSRVPPESFCKQHRNQPAELLGEERGELRRKLRPESVGLRLGT